MLSRKKKFGTTLLLVFFFFFLLSSNPAKTQTNVDYTPISETPLIPKGAEIVTIEAYLNNIFFFVLGIASVLAVIQITLGGIQYMTGSGSGQTGEARKKIWSAVQGLLLILATYIILQQINPNILEFRLGPKDLTPQQKSAPSVTSNASVNQ